MRFLMIILNIPLLLVSGCKPFGTLVSDISAPSGSISINGGAAYTNSSLVTLTFDSSDSAEMYVTNTAGCESGGAWGPYASTKTWTLGQENATATVYVRFKDRSQNVSSCYSDTTVHDGVAPTLSSLAPGSGPVNSIPSTVVAIFSEAIAAVTADKFVISGTCTTLPTVSRVVMSSGDTIATATLSDGTCIHAQTLSITVNPSTVTDSAGNAGTGPSIEKNYTFDSVAPTVVLSSGTANPTSSTISVTATFSESVSIVGAASVTNGTSDSITGSGTSYSFSVTPSHDGYVSISLPVGVAQDVAGNPNAASSVLSRAYVLNTCGASANGCYDHTVAITTGYATVQDGNETTSSPTFIEYKKADPDCSSNCFYLWKETGSNKILNSTGLWEPPAAAVGWQRTLNSDGIGEAEELINLNHIAQIAGRVCPFKTPGSGVFIDYSNMAQTGRCLYYDSGNSAQRLDKDYSAEGGTHGVNWMQNWNTDEPTKGNDYLGTLRGRGTSASYYEGNIKTCNLKGMRLPTLYETSRTSNVFGGTAGQPTGDLTPGGSLSSHPSFAGANGVPSHPSGWTWTTSVILDGDPPLPGDYWAWSDTGFYLSSAPYRSADVLVRCVLP